VYINFFKKNLEKKIQQWALWHNDTWQIGHVYFSMWQTYGHVSKFHVAMLQRVLITRVHMATWINTHAHMAAST
jgi:hypothetical protein